MERETPELKLADPLRLAVDQLYTKTDMDPLMVQRMNLMLRSANLVDQGEKWVDSCEKLVLENEALVEEQDTLVTELVKWVLKVSDLVMPLSNSTGTKENEQAGEDILPWETAQCRALVKELLALKSKLSALISKKVDFEEKRKSGQVEMNKLLMKMSKESLPRATRETVEAEKVKLQKDREELEREKEALKAKANKLGIEEEKLRTTTPEEFQKLVDAQQKLHDDLNILHGEIKTPGSAKDPEEIARLVTVFKLKAKETLLLMNANDKLIEDAWRVLDSMGCVTTDVADKTNWCYYWMKAVAGIFADDIMEDEQLNEGTQISEMDQEQPQVQEVLLDEAGPQEKNVLQVGGGLQ